MSHENFATKYRPATFNDIAGQLSAMGKIDGALKSGRIPRTILISGPYGTGKTSIARLIARYVNCESYGPGSCCAENGFHSGPNQVGAPCPSCMMFEGRDPQHPDYMEANCGDARGIDAIRQMVEAAQMAPRHKYRVLVLDEAQELTKPAASVLLKPLEEPPVSTIWIICTTAKEKILPTLQSRCFSLPVQLVSDKDTDTMLHNIVAAEGHDMGNPVYGVIPRIVEAAQGHPRNAVHGLEAALAYIEANKDLDPEALAASIENAVGLTTILVPKYLTSLLNSKSLALRMCATVQDPEPFLMGVLQGLNAILEILAGFPQTDPQYVKVFDGLAKHPLNSDFAVLRNLYVRAIMDIRQGFDGRGAVNAVTAEALAVTYRWRAALAPEGT